MAEFHADCLYTGFVLPCTTGNMLGKIFKNRAQDAYPESEPPRESISTVEREKGAGVVVDTPIPLFTVRSFVMGIFVSMGGFLFGYDTGQISGFLAMKDFLQRYGQAGPDGKFYFSNVRAGVIVGLVGALLQSSVASLIQMYSCLSVL